MKSMTSHWIGLMTACVFSVCSLWGKDSPPNIIFIFSDDWGWQDLSCHDHPYLQTPNIDRLAQEGADFTRFTVASPVCSPSRAAVMTGQFPARHSIDGHFAWVDDNESRGMPDWLATDAPSLPRMLQQAGYKTAHYGKWHLSNEMIPDSPTPLAYGYDHYAAFNCSGEQMPYDHDVHHAIDFIDRSSAAGAPFFINLWIHEPHTPFHVLPKYLKRFRHLENDADQIYAATLAYADARIGELLDHLDASGLAEDTLVIFSSDNGPARSRNPESQPSLIYDAATGAGFDLGAAKGITGGRKGCKASLHEGGLNVPFLVRWPAKIQPGTVDAQSFITAVDLLPTFCALAGASLPAGYTTDGLDYSSVLLGAPAPQRATPIFSRYNSGFVADEHWATYTAIIDGYKLLLNPKTGREELYYLVSDPKEQDDLLAAQPARVAEMKAQLVAWKATLPTVPAGDVFSSIRGNADAILETKKPYKRYK